MIRTGAGVTSIDRAGELAWMMFKTTPGVGISDRRTVASSLKSSSARIA